MAQQPDLAAILAALGQQQSSGTPKPGSQTTPQPPLPAGYPGVVSAATPSNPLAGLALPQPSTSGSLDLSSIKPVNSGSVSLADAIAKAKGIAAERGSVREDPRVRGGGYARSRSRSRSPPRRDNYRDNYNPYRDERRDDPRRGGANGRERSTSPPRNQSTFSPGRNHQHRDRSPPARKADDNTEIISIDSSSVGLVIGRAGENLRRVESETGARVQFMPDNHTPLRQCKVSGTPRQRADAIQDIYRVAAENPRAQAAAAAAAAAAHVPAPTPQQYGGSPYGSDPNAQAGLAEGDKSTQIMVPDRTVGLIIGRGGETIRDLQERSGCHVNIVGENKSINGLRPVNLIGSVEASNKAKALIMEIVDSDTRSGPPGGAQPPPQQQHYGRAGGGGSYEPYPQYDPSGGAKITDSIVVPSEAVGMIIGKGGETIKEMQNVTGCKINVSPASGADISREIGLIGTRMAIDSAKRAIWEKVSAVREKQGGTFTRGGDVAPPYDPYAHQPPPYGQPPPMPPSQAMPPPVADQPDPYAAYGGYQNYIAMWYAAFANPGGQGGPPQGP